jgi:hypothetical protein
VLGSSVRLSRATKGTTMACPIVADGTKVSYRCDLLAHGSKGIVG